MAARIVILGGGFAGVSAARELHRLDGRGSAGVSVTLVNRNNFSLFTPMLPEVASDGIETRHVVEPFRAMRAGFAFELADATSLDARAKVVTVRHPVTGTAKTLEYDELAIALGSTSSDFGIAGVKRHAIPLETIEDAAGVRARTIAALEAAAAARDRIERDRCLRFVVVGGGFSGVEAAGELWAFVRSAVRYYPQLSEGGLELVLVESGNALLAHLPVKFGKRAAAALRGRGIGLRLGEKVAGVDECGMSLEGAARIESRTIVWCAGTRPSPFGQKAGLKTDKHGAIEVDGDFSVKGTAHVWAAGDCAAVPKPGGGTYAPLAQNAVREGPLLARNLLASLAGKPTRTFRYRELGQMASLGNREGLAELPGGRMISGTPAWILWRAYYLARLPGFNRKLRVAMDWAVGAAFGADVARLPLVGGSSFEEHHAAGR